LSPISATKKATKVPKKALRPPVCADAHRNIQYGGRQVVAKPNADDSGDGVVGKRGYEDAGDDGPGFAILSR
jgi:hypothetical protein